MKKTILGIILMTTTMIAAERTAYVGTYTKPAGSKGIYMLRFDEATGKLSTPELAAETPNPSFLTISRGGKFLYAVNEANDGTISAFAIQPALLPRWQQTLHSGRASRGCFPLRRAPSVHATAPRR